MLHRLPMRARNPSKTSANSATSNDPRTFRFRSLVALFELVGLSEGFIRDPNTREDGIKQLTKRRAASSNESSLPNNMPSRDCRAGVTN